ncbi:MAG: LuxR C-terminal-related transcriptional regulator [Chloroflexota bacterium]
MLLQTKLFVPPAADALVPRPHLLERLNAGLKGKLTFVAAPAGFGKTTLIASWLNDSNFDRKVAWLSLDEDDNLPQQFYRYVAAALQPLTDSPLQLHQLAKADQPVSSKSFAKVWVMDALTIEEPFLLVLDDLHVIDSSEIYEAITFLLEHMPPQMHLAITGRADPLIPLSRLRARRQMTEIRAADLRFETAEIQTFLQFLSLEITLDQAELLNQRTEGWAAGLQLAALAMQSPTADKNRGRFIQSFAGNHRFVIDYLTDEVLRGQPLATEAFLLQTSLLERFNADLCAALVPDADASTILQTLERANLFLVPLDDQRNWYRYHHLFADLLRQRLSERFSAEDINHLHGHATAWLAEHDFVDEAIHHARACGHWSDVSAAVTRLGTKQINHGLANLTSGWLNQIPDEVVRKTPGLAIDKAWLLYMEYRVDEMVPYLEAAEKEKDDLAHVGETAVMRTFYLLMKGNIEDARRQAEAMCEQLGNSFPAETGGLRVVLGNAYEAMGESEKSGVAFTQAAEELLAGENWMGYSAAIVFLIRHHLEAGRLNEAYKVGSQFMTRYSSDARLQHGGGAQAVVYYALVLFERRDNSALQFVAEQVEQALELTKLMMPDIAVVIWMNLTLALIKQASGDQIEADELVRDAADRLNAIDQNQTMFVYYELFVRYYLASQQHENAEILMGQLAELDLPESNPVASLHQLHQVELLLQKGAPPAELETALTRLKSLNEPVIKLRAQVLTVLIQHQLGHSEEALESLELALEMAASQGWVAIFDTPVGRMIELLRTVRPTSSQQPFIDCILNALDKTANEHKSSKIQVDGVVLEQLSERELEVLRLVAEGYSNREISERLFLAVGTVKRHLNNINSKLYASSRTQAVARARELGLL